jgi:hypothetical protein
MGGMNIDLLFTEDGAAGLVASANFPRRVAGALFDRATGAIELEFVEADPLALNIPVADDLREALAASFHPFIGAVKGGKIAQAYQIPLAVLGDDYHAQTARRVQAAATPLVAFARFMERCVAGQPVHRADLGDEDASGCVLGDASPVALQFAPHLAQQHALEIAPRGPSAPGPRGPGMGLGGGGGGTGGGYFIPPTDGE